MSTAEAETAARRADMTDPAPKPLVVCLCAAWCGSCRDYRATFDQLAARFAGEADFAWIDVEDESDALGDPDIENFPTLLVDAPGRLFLGPVMPQPGAAERLVRAALDGSLAEPRAADAALAERVRRLARQQRYA